MHQLARLKLFEFNVEKAASHTTEDLDIYIRDVDGDDDNNGLSIVTPMKTFEAAIAKHIPLIIDHTVIFHIGLHSGTGYKFPIFGTKLLNDRLHVYGDGGGVGDGQTETLAPTVMQSGTNEATIVGTGGYSVDAFRGHTLEILDGPCAGYRKLLHSNTTDDFLLVTDTDRLGLIPVAGNTFRIFRPAVVINMSEGVASGAGIQVASGVSKGTNGMLCFSQLAFYATQQQAIRFRDLDVGFFGVEQDQAAANLVDWNFEGQTAWLGTDASTGHFAEVMVDLGAPDRAAWNGWGHYRVDSGDSNTGSPFSVFGQGGIAANVHAFIVSNKGFRVSQNIFIRGGSIRDTSVGGFSAAGLSFRTSGFLAAQRVGGTFFNTHKTIVDVSTDRPCISMSNSGLLDAVGLDMRWVDGLAFELLQGARVMERNCTGEPSGTGSTVLVNEGALHVPQTDPVLGHATELDYNIVGVTPGINKSDLVTPGDGLAGIAGTIVRR